MKTSELPEGYEVVQTDPGRAHTYTGKRSLAKRTVQIDRVWEVRFNGEAIGIIVYEMVTHEQRTPGRRYVNSRWQVPAYRYSREVKRYGRKSEAHSRAWAVSSIIDDHKRENKK